MRHLNGSPLTTTSEAILTASFFATMTWCGMTDSHRCFTTFASTRQHSPEANFQHGFRRLPSAYVGFWTLSRCTGDGHALICRCAARVPDSTVPPTIVSTDGWPWRSIARHGIPTAARRTVCRSSWRRVECQPGSAIFPTLCAVTAAATRQLRKLCWYGWSTTIISEYGSPGHASECPGSPSCATVSAYTVARPLWAQLRYQRLSTAATCQSNRSWHVPEYCSAQ